MAYQDLETQLRGQAVLMRIDCYTLCTIHGSDLRDDPVLLYTTKTVAPYSISDLAGMADAVQMTYPDITCFPCES